jgi:hypothetical protein
MDPVCVSGLFCKVTGCDPDSFVKKRLEYINAFYWFERKEEWYEMDYCKQVRVSGSYCSDNVIS